MVTYIALLRGINVGGKNKLRMAELKSALETAGLSNVQTYIQSGNILFQSEKNELTLRVLIEQLIEQEFGLQVRTIIRTAEQIKQLVNHCPFSEEELKAAEASGAEALYVSLLMDLPHEDKVEKLQAVDYQPDQYRIVDRDMYLLFYNSIRNSKLATQVEKLGVPVTTRNWKTMNKLVALSEKML